VRSTVLRIHESPHKLPQPEPQHHHMNNRPLPRAREHVLVHLRGRGLAPETCGHCSDCLYLDAVCELSEFTERIARVSRKEEPVLGFL
jgi:hypothetical protein